MHGVILALFVPSDVLFENSVKWILPSPEIRPTLGFISSNGLFIYPRYSLKATTDFSADNFDRTSFQNSKWNIWQSGKVFIPLSVLWFIPLWLQVFNTIVTSLFSWSRWSGSVFEGLEEVWEMGWWIKSPFVAKLIKKV